MIMGESTRKNSPGIFKLTLEKSVVLVRIVRFPYNWYGIDRLRQITRTD